MSAGDLLRVLRAQREAMADLITTLALIETPSHEPASQRHALDMLGRSLTSVDYVVHLLPGCGASGGCLLAMPKGPPADAPRQLILGHMDTVWPRGTLAEMPLRRDGATLHGPGVYDMKAGLAQMVFALRALRELGLEPSVTPHLLVNTDEEIGSGESREHIQRGAMGADRAFVLEPTAGLAGALKTARKGIGRYNITVRGRAAHAGLNPEQGISAILELTHQVQALFGLNDPHHGLTVNVGTIDGGSVANVVAAEARAVVDVRAPDQAGADKLDAAIRSLSSTTDDAEVLVTGGFGRPPMERTPGGEKLWELAHHLGNQLGLDLEEAAVGGGSDGNTTSQYCPTLDGLGAVGGGAHAHDERVDLDASVERAALLALLLLSPPLEMVP